LQQIESKQFHIRQRPDFTALVASPQLARFQVSDKLQTNHSRDEGADLTSKLLGVGASGDEFHEKIDAHF
jgi:hypothetical protein